MDKTKRISLINEVAEILSAKSGDEIEYVVSTNGITIRKVTTPYKGYDIEQDLISEERINYLLRKAIQMLQERNAEEETKGEDYEKIRKEYIENRKKENKKS